MIVNLCGAGSSGSTFLAQMLDRHPRIACGDELYLFNKPLLYSDFPRFRRLRRLIRHFGLSANPYHPDRTLFHNVSAYGLDAGQVWRWVAECADFTDLVSHFQRHVQALTGKPVWVEKTPSNSRLLGSFLDTFPTAKAIHLVRDPRDQVLSQMRRGNSLEAAARIWLTAVAAVQPVRSRTNLLELRYEDLVNDFDGQMRRICGFFDLDFDAGYFSSGIHASASLQKGRGHDSWRARPGEGPSRISVGRYRESGIALQPLLAARLTPQYAALLGTPRFAVHELMAEYGYAVDPGEIRPVRGLAVASAASRNYPRDLINRLVDGCGPLPGIEL